MKKSANALILMLILIATIIWFSGSWWYYSCKVKNTCKNLELSSQETTTTTVIDSDSDGLSDLEEKTLGTNPASRDSDQDGTPDNEEVGGSINAPLDTDNDGIINALDEDDDNDGLPSLLESKLGTNPLLTDSDQDGFSDSEEIGRNPKRPLDTDGDGINNALDTDDDDDGILTSEEILLGTNFLLADSDGDGLSDSMEIGEHIEKPLDTDNDGIINALDTEDNINQEEVVNTSKQKKLDSADAEGIDPLNKENNTDTDNDGLSDSQEEILGSNPNSADSDNDGISDKLEVGDDINSPLDTDNDGILNINDTDDDNDKLSTSYESQIGTNPISADSNGNGINDYEEQKLLRNKLKAGKSQVSNKDSINIEKFGSSNNNNFQKARIYFPFRSKNPELTPNAANYFSAVARWMKRNPKSSILLVGHTDSLGSKKANLSLGLQRVITIREFLIKNGANLKQIEIMSKGEAEPIASNKTKEGRLRNRRVEIGPFKK